MKKKMMVIVMLVSLVLLVISGCSKGVGNGGGGNNLKESLAVDVSNLKSSDGQPLLQIADKKEIPARPDNPEKLPEDDAGHWYDQEYLGWNIKKVNIPKSPANGAKDKKMVMILSGDHPYFTAFKKGAQQIADAYQMKLEFKSANWSVDTQSQLVDQAINDKPDMIFVLSVDANAAASILRKINQANIPVITRDSAKGLEYALSMTGFDDWRVFRELSREFAKKMNYEGGYTIVQHVTGTLPYYARTYSVISELKKIAPKMKLLDQQSTALTAEKSLQVTADWLTRFGSELKGIISADDASVMVGINEAIKNANRQDILRVASGNSKIGMDAVKAGTLDTITYLSAEGDGALPVKIAADWFNGKNIDPVYYTAQSFITKKNVDSFYPAQW